MNLRLGKMVTIDYYASRTESSGGLGMMLLRWYSCDERHAVKAWTLLVIAGLLESGWAVGLKSTHGWTRLWPSLWTIAALIASMVLLAIAVRDLPIGTAYPVWVGIGSVGAAVWGISVLGESASPWRLFFIALLIASIIGLRMTSQSPAPAPPPIPMTKLP
jgi:quaternary ammonium compound-resistance protein SugE